MGDDYIDPVGIAPKFGRVETRFQQYLAIARKCGYLVFLQHICFSEFGHHDLCILSPVQMDQLMTITEAIVLDTAYQLRIQDRN